MDKGRLVAFTDAVIAIVITILVLDLELPTAPTVEALWEIREGFFAYAVSFFWIGATWINLHNQWHRARRITTCVVWHSVLMLFFISLIPYVTRFAGSNLMSMFALGVYWAVSLLTTVNFMAQGYALGYYNRDDPEFLASARVLFRNAKGTTVLSMARSKRRNWPLISSPPIVPQWAGVHLFYQHKTRQKTTSFDKSKLVVFLSPLNKSEH